MALGWKRAAMLLALAVAGGESALADTVALNPLQDNTLYQDNFGQTSNGSGEHFFAGRTAAGLIRRGLVSFDIAGNVPAGSTIQSVTLVLHMSRAVNTAEVEVDLHQALSAWGEGASVADGNEGAGATPPAAGDATWLHTFYDTDFWAQPGGDFAGTVSGSAAVSDVGFYSFASDFNPGMLVDAQQWLDQPGTNQGWVLMMADEFFPMSAKRFDSRENANPNFQPMLTVNYAGGGCGGDGGETVWNGRVKEFGGR